MTKKTKGKGAPFLVLFLLLLLMSGGAFFSMRNTKLFLPLKYQNIIEQYSQKYELDPALVATVIWKESSYKETAKSSKGALGLMQLMPQTAEEVAGKLGEDYDKEKLSDPETSIRYGTYYLSTLDRYYKGNLRKMLAAYNAGMGNVDQWLKKQDSKKELEEIPIRETKDYVETIMEKLPAYREKLEEGKMQ